MSTQSNKVVNISNTVKLFNDRISWDEYFMSLAVLTSARSSCNRLHVGCVLVKDKRVVSAGYNGFLANAPHVSRIRNNHEQNTCHAEVNAITDCAKRGVSCKDSIAYITHHPCLSCLKCLASAGITKIYHKDDYKNDELCIKLAKDINLPIIKI